MKHWLPLLAVVALSVAHNTHAQTVTARGMVFHDRNHDGIRQAGEEGIPGVAVSDGQQVIRTDDHGTYTLEINDEDTILFIVKPRGYQVTIDRLNLPRYYYIHKPQGSPDDNFIFPGVEPTGPLPEMINFPLYPVEEPEDFTIIAFGDPQPYSRQQIDFFRREVIDPLTDHNGNTVGAAFGISLGDLVGDNLAYFELLNQAQALLGVPWYNVLGNHDMNFMSGSTDQTKTDPDKYSDETMERVYGPLTYAFQYGKVHFILMDNVKYNGFTGYLDGTYEDWPDGKRSRPGNYESCFRDDQLAFIENYLSIVPKDDLIVLGFHIPLNSADGQHKIPQTDRLMQILSGHPHTLSISGHTHYQKQTFLGEETGYKPDPALGKLNQHVLNDAARFPKAIHHHDNLVTVSGSWFGGTLDEEGVPHTTMRDGAPNGYTLIHFEGNRYRTEFRAARRPASHQMTLTVTEPAADDQPAFLYANVFRGVQGDKVQTRLRFGPTTQRAPTPWKDMTYTEEKDPLYLQLRERQKNIPAEARSNGLIANTQTSYHLWKTPLPNNLPKGTHALEVRHTDLFGQVNIDRYTIRVD
ncbi:calcineurin-like phosphoesterase C-terminal domain-containing protein [Mucisphaera calidilacus]|uniref:Metallophosphoesterase n=1 Tax=Mucisphaera calidilacus TaxID=2527982 RepID=A0A518BZM1_9BACT|nr:calcineurin-like phosphoesterase family protein [Mucisphaera calidilacus]QDU72420.1 hypothetical protein Pan265_22850 [Mucisphaera calidilacus]